MFTLIWLVVWLSEETPVIRIAEKQMGWNDWGIALLICAAIDIIRAISRD